MIVVRNGAATCRRLRDIKAGDTVVVGMKGIRVVPEAKERDRLAFAFMSNEISSERQVETAVGSDCGLMHQARAEGKKIVAVAGPVVVHTGGGDALSSLIRNGWIDALLAGNALAVHDIESALLGTSLGVRTQRWSSGTARPSEPHARHQRHQSRWRYRGSRAIGPAHHRRHV